MLSRPIRVLVSLSTAALVLAPTASAQAATTSTAKPSLVSVTQARQALPDPADMPGKPQAEITSSSPLFGKLQPCLGPDQRPLTMKQSHPVTRIYENLGAVSDPNLVPTTFIVTAVVFHTTAAAKTGLAAVLRAEKHCPKQGGDAQASITRTLSQAYSPRGWTGWRSIDHLAIAGDPTDGSTGIALRLTTELIERGNVLLAILETGADTPGSGAVQDKARKQAVTAVLNGFAKL